MTKKSIYRITVLNWVDYNSNHKKSYKKFMLANNFFTDAKIRILPMTSRWLFLNLLAICSDLCRDTVEVSSKCVRNMLESNRNIDGVLDELQSLQLVTYEKTSLIEEKIREEKIKEEKLIPKGVTKSKNIKTASPQPLVEPVGRILMARYCELWKDRYGVNPSIQKHHPKLLKDVGEQNGSDKTIRLLEAYFMIPDPWFIKRGHDIPTFVSNLASITRFMETGKVISNSELRQMDSAVSSQNTLDAIRRGEV